MWYYKSPIGLMCIYLDSNNKYALKINDIVYGHFSSPVSAADDVYTHMTGCDEWDLLDGTLLDVPADIYEWDKR